MKKLLLLVVLILSCAPKLVLAQGSKTPEFQLVVQYDEKGNHQRPRQFGYDPSATFGTDTAFGETRDVPQSSAGDGVPNLYFLYTDPVFHVADTGTWTDILPKPSADSFYLQYPLEVSTEFYPGTLSWDTTTIPSNVTAIWLTPRLHPGDVLADMKHVSSYSISTQDYFNNGIDYMITLFYNMTPAPKSGVTLARGLASGIFANVSAYPNPFVSSGSLAYDLNSQATIFVGAYDLTGKQVGEASFVQVPGRNRVDLNALVPDRGTYLVRLRAVSGGSIQEQTVLVKRD